MTTKLALVGDINCKRDVLVDTALDRVDPELERADVRLGNLEGAFHDPSVELEYKPGWYHCEPDAVSFVTGRFDAVACANNVHYGAAIATSTALLDDVGIGHAGAGRDRSAARRPAIVHGAGATVGLLAFTSVHWPIGHVATSSEPAPPTSHIRASSRCRRRRRSCGLSRSRRTSRPPRRTCAGCASRWTSSSSTAIGA
jgi:hypothetical protein